MKVLIALPLIVVFGLSSAFAEPPADREAAMRYAKAVSIEDVIDEMLAFHVRAVPVQERKRATDAIRSRLNNEKLLHTYVDILVSVYTTEELNALADFYSSSIGVSVHSKRGQVPDKYWLFREEIERAVKQAASDLQTNVQK